MTASLRIGLVDTSNPDQPGSMREYADTLEHALGAHASEIAIERHQLFTTTSRTRWSRRLQTLGLLRRSWGLRARQVDVWHHLDGSRAYLGLALGRVPQVVTAHDVIPYLQAQGQFPQAPAVGRAARWLWLANARMTRSAAFVACDSQATQRDLQRHFAVASSRCAVVPLPVRHSLVGHLQQADYSLRDRLAVICGRVLHVGSNAFYKNREQVLRIFAGLNVQLGRQLVMVGPPPTAELIALSQQLQLGERVVWVDDCDDATVALHYRQAALMLFPSLYEGYGWPVLEAMAMGVPVLASDSGSLPELVGDASTTWPAHDLPAWIAASERLLGSESAANAASDAGCRRASEFTAKRFAVEMLAIYRRAAPASGQPGSRR